MHRRTAVDSHLSGYGHKQNVLNEGRKQRMEMMSLNYFLLFYRIERLGLLSWKWHIKGMIFDHIYHKNFDASDIERQLEQYEQMERTSLLELAVWGASCLHFDGSRNFHTMQDILDQWALDEHFDPAAYKSDRRFTSSVAVVMRNVTEFL